MYETHKFSLNSLYKYKNFWHFGVENHVHLNCDLWIEKGKKIRKSKRAKLFSFFNIFLSGWQIKKFEYNNLDGMEDVGLLARELLF